MATNGTHTVAEAARFADRVDMSQERRPLILWYTLIISIVTRPLSVLFAIHKGPIQSSIAAYSGILTRHVIQRDLAELRGRWFRRGGIQVRPHVLKIRPPDAAAFVHYLYRHILLASSHDNLTEEQDRPKSPRFAERGRDPAFHRSILYCL